MNGLIVLIYIDNIKIISSRAAVNFLKQQLCVTDLINRIVLILKRDLEQFQTSTRDAELLNQEDPGDKG